MACVEILSPDEVAVVHVTNRTVRRCFLIGDDTEVARRWLMLCPKRRMADQQPEEPTEFQLNMIRQDPARVQQIRSRLSDIS